MKATFETYSRDLLAGILLVACAIIIQTWLMGVAVIFLDIGMTVALWVWAVQAKRMSDSEVLRIYAAALVIHCFHFLEEFIAGFQVQFPRLFGYEWSDRQFAAFNLVWIVLFVLNGIWLSSRTRLSYLLVYILAIVGGIANGVAHPLLSVREGGYFPGLITSPLVFLAGLAVLKKLLKNT